METYTRRRALALSGSVLTTGVAGCTGLTDGDTGSKTDGKTEGNSSQDTEELEQRIDELESENERLREEANKTPEDTSELEAELEAEKERAEELRAELNETEDSSEELEAELAAREEKIKELEQQAGSYYDEDTVTAAEEVMHAAKDAVVYIDLEHSGNTGSHGTGWFIDDHTIVTNGHVIAEYYDDEAEEMTIYTKEQDALSFTIAGVEEVLDGRTSIDIGIIKTEETALATLDLGETDDVDVGDPLVQVGHPSLFGNWVGSLGERRSDGYTDSLKMEIPSKGGNSGSPVMTLDGDVVGCTYSGSAKERLIDDDGVPKNDMTELYMVYRQRDKKEESAQTTDTIREYYEDWK